MRIVKHTSFTQRQILAMVLLLPLLALTLYAVYQVGYWGIIDYHWRSVAGWQVIVDLVIACVLIVIWMVADARHRGLNPWPFVIITVFLGSIGPLIYLLIGTSNTPITLAQSDESR